MSLVPEHPGDDPPYCIMSVLPGQPGDDPPYYIMSLIHGLVAWRLPTLMYEHGYLGSLETTPKATKQERTRIQPTET